MASLRDIRKRIKSVKNSEKITRAMKMVAAAKLKRAQEQVRCARPYAKKMGEVVSHLAKRLEAGGDSPHPLLEKRQVQKKVEVLVLTSDRGLCGAFNSNIVRSAQRLIFDVRNKHEEIHVRTLGKKGYEAFSRDKVSIRKNYEGVLDSPNYARAFEISQEICRSYISDEVDAVYLVYNEFKSAISQKVIVKQMLPVEPKEVADEEGLVDYAYEPNQKELLSHLVPKHFATELYQSFLESVASEYGARMTAMDNATRNAKDMISSLTLSYNRARQAAITKELMEIIGGSEALSA